MQSLLLQKFCICILCICILCICRLCRSRQGKRERVWAGQATSYLASPLPHRHRLTYLYFPVSVFVLQHLGYFSIAMPCNRYLGVWCWNHDVPPLFYPPHRGNTRILNLQFSSNPVSIFPQFISSIEIHPDVCSTIRKYS